MSDIAKTFTKAELIEKAREYSQKTWADCGGEVPVELQEQKIATLGTVCGFIFDLFEDAQ